jgi:phage recombination protein Bet
MAAKKNDTKSTQTGICEYEANGETVKLSPGIIRNYLVSGGGNVTDQEVMMFLMLCKSQHLNPFVKEAYLIKYGSSPATMVVGKDVFVKRAYRNERFRGLQAGVTVISRSGERLIERAGTIVIEGERLVGGWAKVYIKDYAEPIYTSVNFGEYSTGKSNWVTKPATMIRKVALSQALREAFPEDLQGLYEAEEMSAVNKSVDMVNIVENSQPVEMPQEAPAPEPAPEDIPPVNDAEYIESDFVEVEG